MFGKLLIIAGAAINITSFGEETLRSDWPFAAETGETVIVPGVAFVLHTLCAFRRKIYSVIVISAGGRLCHKTPSARCLSAAGTKPGFGLDCLTSHYRLVAAVAAWRILSGAALPTHDAVVLGAEGLLGQRLVTLCTTETLLMPVPALMAELLMGGGTEES